jgi:hypothetical protein
MVRAQVPLPIVSRLMNHTSVETTMRYVKAGSGELAEWLAREGREGRPHSLRDEVDRWA